MSTAENTLAKRYIEQETTQRLLREHGYMTIENDETTVFLYKNDQAIHKAKYTYEQLLFWVDGFKAGMKVFK